jgi:hypothetical protein
LNANHNVDIASTPPCKVTHKEHIKRSNYQVAHWKKVLEPISKFRAASAGHGWINIDGILEPVSSAEDLILPTYMVDFLVEFSDSDSDEEQVVIFHVSKESLFDLF